MLKRLILQQGKGLKCVVEIGGSTFAHLFAFNDNATFSAFINFFWDVDRLFCYFSSSFGVSGWNAETYDFVRQSVRVRIDRPLDT